MNNGSNGGNRNNRYSNGSRSPYPANGNRRSSYDQGNHSRYPEYDGADSFYHGGSAGNRYPSSDYQRTGTRRTPVDDSDYLTYDDDSLYNYLSTDHSFSDDYGYSGGGNSGYSDRRNTGYSRGRDSRYSDRRDSVYSNRRNTGYSDRRDSGYSDRRDSGYSDRRNTGYSDRRDSGYSRGRNTGYSDRRDSGYSRRSSSRYSVSRSAGNQNDSHYGKSGKRAYSNYGYSQTADKNEKLPVSVFFGIGVTVIAVMILIISISIDSNKSKNRAQSYADSETSPSDINGATIVEVPDDDENDPDGNTDSSRLVTQSFIGLWYKTDVDEANKATFTVTMQYVDSFEFRMDIWNGTKSAAISGTAFYTDETHADYTPKKNAKIVFERGADYVNVTHTGSNSSFGVSTNFMIDGKFTEQEPEYAAESNASSESVATVTYDYDIYKSDEVVNALRQTLRSDDYELYDEMMTNGLKSPIDYERTKDKNGRLVNVDAELNAVKYYAHLSDNGYDMIFICSDTANIYVLFYNSEEIVYYTNDKNYSSTMPASFQAVAKAKNIKPTFR